MTIKQVKVYSPGSIANLGPGFDVFGIALEGLGDIVLLEAINEPEIKLSAQGAGADKIPLEPKKNSSGAVLEHIRDEYDVKHGFRAHIRKGISPGTGMGSSGASAAATAVGVDHILELGLSLKELVKLAAIGEGAVAGSPHADNVGASIMGGFILVGENYDIIRLDPPKVRIVIVVPDIYINNKTRVARELLPEKISLRDAVKNIGYASRMTAAVALKDSELFGKSICDSIIEPYRASMIPHFWEVKEAAIEAGAWGCSISGGGPSVFAVGENLEEIGDAMADAFKEVKTSIFYTSPSNLGARVI